MAYVPGYSPYLQNIWGEMYPQGIQPSAPPIMSATGIQPSAPPIMDTPAAYGGYDLGMQSGGMEDYVVLDPMLQGGFSGQAPVYFDNTSNALFRKPTANPSLTYANRGDQQGYYFATNAGRPAKTKANKEAFVPLDPNMQYRLIDERTGKVAASGTGEQGLQSAYQTAQQLSAAQGKKADWKLEVFDPTANRWTVQADDDPKFNALGMVADLALPIAGALLMPGLGAGLGAAGGSMVSSALQGRSLGDTLLRGGITGLTAGALSGAGAALGAGGGSTASGVGGTLGGSLAAAGPAASAAVQAFAPQLLNQIVVQGALGAGLGAGLGSAAGAGIGSLAGSALTGMPYSGGGGGGQQGPFRNEQGDLVLTGTAQPAAPVVPVPGAPIPSFSVPETIGNPITVEGQVPQQQTEVPAALPSFSVPETIGNPITVEGQVPQQPQFSEEGALGAATGSALGNVFNDPFGNNQIVVENTPNTVRDQPIPIPSLLPNPITPQLPSIPTSVPQPDVPDPEIVVERDRPIDALLPTSIAPVLPNLIPPSVPQPNVTAPEGNGLSLDKIIDILRAAGLLSTLAGGLGGGGRGNGSNVIPSGFGAPGGNFNSPLPAANIPGVGAGVATRPQQNKTTQDWYRYGYGPEQSFFNYVPEGEPNRSTAFTGYAEGGEVSPFAVGGPGTGRSDEIPALLSDGEYVIDAETVALLGDGSSKAGADILDDFRVRVRKHKGKQLAKGGFSAKAKKPEQYLGGKSK